MTGHALDSSKSTPVHARSARLTQPSVILGKVRPRTVRGLLILLLAVVLVPVLLVQGGIYYSRYQELRSTEYQANHELADLVSATVETYIQDVLHQELALGASLISAGSITPDQAEAQMRVAASERKEVAVYEWLAADGRVLGSSDGARRGMNAIDESSFRQILAGKDWAVSDVLRQADSQTSFFISRALRAPNNALLGVITAEIRPQLLASILSIDRIGSGAATVIDSRGQIVFRYPDRPTRGAEGVREGQMASFQPILEQVRRGEEPVVILSTPGGGDRITAFVAIPSVGWFATASRAVSDVTDPIVQSLMRDVAINLLVGLIAFALALVVGRQITGPLRRLQLQSQALGRGDTVRPIAPGGPQELIELAQSFNRMAEEMRQRECEREAFLTRERAALAESQRHAEQLHRVEQIREEFISTVSHDLRNPLTAIMGQAQLLSRKLVRSPMESEVRSAEAIIANARRMNSMIEELVDSQRFESGTVELNLQLADPVHLVADVCDRAIPLAQQARLQIDAPEEVPLVVVDVARMERVLVNLITNAFKYSPAESPVRVAVEYIDDGMVVSVKDEGTGIAQSDLGRIFDRYYRTELNKKQEGLGLGLYISRMIVEAHGGHIWAESSLGEGSTFFVSLPVKQI